MYEVTDSKGKWLANAPLSAKDARDAVVAARKAFGGWSGATAYNRGQILYRVAEMLEGRKDRSAVGEVAADAGGLSKSKVLARLLICGDRPLGLVRGLDRQDRPGGGRRQPGRGSLFAATWSRRASSPSSRPRSRPSWAWSR